MSLTLASMFGIRLGTNVVSVRLYSGTFIIILGFVSALVDVSFSFSSAIGKGLVTVASVGTFVLISAGGRLLHMVSVDTCKTKSLI